MNIGSKLFESRPVGLALSGGSFRGVAHIGVIRAITEAGIRPAVVVGTSAGSIIGAALASGMGWEEMARMARSTFWPGLLDGGRLERYCAERLPASFADLRLTFAAVATDVEARRPVAITDGPLASAISASCATRVRRPVCRDGRRLKDGGFTCVLPSAACRELGAEVVVASDVWQRSWALGALGCDPTSPGTGWLFPEHYRAALQRVDLLVRPGIPLWGGVPYRAAVDRLVEVGYEATRRALRVGVDPRAR